MGNCTCVEAPGEQTKQLRRRQKRLKPLPPGWVERKDSSGTCYYANTISRTTQWERPSAPRISITVRTWDDEWPETAVQDDTVGEFLSDLELKYGFEVTLPPARKHIVWCRHSDVNLLERGKFVPYSYT